MTVIRPNSVSGITSITAQANEINVFRSNGTLAGLNLNGVNFNTTAGISTLAALKVSGNLDVEGVLTYQDVTNVDSLGIGTFRTGINVSGGQLDVGSNIKLGNAGVITATSFSGDGSQLTGISAGVSLANGVDNRVVTATGAAALNGESTLTYNGSGTLEISSSGSAYILRGAGITKHELGASASDNDLVIQNNKDSGNITSNIIFKGSGSGGATVSEKMRITNTGVGINHDTSGASTNAALTIKNRVSSSATRFNLVNSGSSQTESTQIYSQNNDLVFVAGANDRLRIEYDGTTSLAQSCNLRGTTGNSQIIGLMGAKTTGGTTNWNDATNARSGNGYTLLLGSHSNGPGGNYYYHVICFEYSSKNGSGNLTQIAIPYTSSTIYLRYRYSGNWSSWVQQT